MDTILLNVMERLETIAELQYVSEDWGQLNFEQPPVNWPCALVDFGEVKYTQAGRQTQQADAILNITVADIRFDGLNTRLPEKNRDRIGELFRIIEKVNNVIHGYGTGSHSRFQRIALKKIIREDAVREFLITYRFGFTDQSAMTEYTNRPTPPNIVVEE